MEKKKQQHSSVKIDRQATQDFYCQNAACSNDVVFSFPFSLEGKKQRFRFDNQPLFVISPIKSIPFLNFSRDHLRSTSGITYVRRGSFAVHFRDHLRSRDHLRMGIICGTVLLFIGAPLTAIFTI